MTNLVLMQFKEQLRKLAECLRICLWLASQKGKIVDGLWSLLLALLKEQIMVDSV